MVGYLSLRGPSRRPRVVFFRLCQGKPSFLGLSPYHVLGLALELLIGLDFLGGSSLKLFLPSSKRLQSSLEQSSRTIMEAWNLTD